METVIEARVGEETLRVRRAGNGQFILEVWVKEQNVWKTKEAHDEFYITLHGFFDEVCKRAEKLRREMEKN